MRDTIDRIKYFLFEKRIQISGIVVLLIVVNYLYEKRIPYDVFEYPGYFGTVLVVLGVFLRSWAAGIIIKNKKLITCGPYCFCRHPLYLGTFLISIGFCFILNDIKNLIVILFFMLLIYLPKMKEEEKKLAKEFRDSWNEYFKNTSNLIPNLKDINHPWSFNLWLKNKEHYTFLGCFIGLIALKIWNDFYF